MHYWYMRLNLNWLWHWLADVPHGGARLGGFEGCLGAVGAGDGQVAVVVRDVGIGARLGRRHYPARQRVLLLLLRHLQGRETGISDGRQGSVPTCN